MNPENVDGGKEGLSKGGSGSTELEEDIGEDVGSAKSVRARSKDWADAVRIRPRPVVNPPKLDEDEGCAVELVEDLAAEKSSEHS